MKAYWISLSSSGKETEFGNPPPPPKKKNTTLQALNNLNYQTFCEKKAG